MPLSTTYQPFQHLKIVELASVLAGPAVGMFFAELGATVIKVENKTTQGDVTRTWKLPQEQPNDPLSAYYCSVNWNKEVLWADLEQPSDRQTVYKLIETADIVISNFKGGDSQKLGVDYHTLQTINPTLIYGEITAFGRDSRRVGYDMVLQAESGMLFMNGLPDHLPVKLPIAMIDILAAHQLKEGILLALLERQHTQKGSYISVSLLETAIASLANQATNWLIAGHIPQRLGSEHPNIAPYGEMFGTKDGQLIVLAVGSQKQFETLCHILHLNDLIKDERFANNAARVQNRKALFDVLNTAIAQQESDVLLATMHEKGVPVGLVRNMQAVFDLAEAQAMLLHYPNDYSRTCVRTIAFRKIE